MSIVNLEYSGSTPGADAGTYPLFSSVTAFPGAGMHQQQGLHTLRYDIKNDQAGTLKLYKSADRGTTWSQVAQTSIAAAAAGVSNTDTFSVEAYPDFKLDWVNGGSAQATWAVSLNLSSFP